MFIDKIATVLLTAGLCASLGLMACSDDATDNTGGTPQPDAPPEPEPNPDPNPAPMNPDPNPAPMNPDPNPEPEVVCGDGACEDGEDLESCPEDCTPDPICAPGEARCLTPTSLEVCNEDGSAFVEQPCDLGATCVTEQNACRQVICEPGAVDACASQTSINICNETGTGTIEQTCDEGLFCDFINGLFTCTNAICTPGEVRCRGLEGTERCADDGTEWVAGETCAQATQCDDGECTSLCEINSKVSSFLGCQYWSLDLDNVEGARDSAHAVVISNPHPELDAEITVTRSNGDILSVPQWNNTVGPGQQGIFIFDGSYTDTNTNTPLLDTGYIDGTMIGDQAFRFESSIPTTAHQFNPLVENNVFSNDASLLLPTNAAGQEYLALSWKHRSTIFTFRGFINVLAVGDGPTTITVTPTVTVAAGSNRINNSPIESIGGGESREFVLMPGQFLNIETNGPELADLTGTQILSDLPVIVYSGHECANLPTVTTNYCDHIEQQMFPVTSWGEQYVVSSFVPRDLGDKQMHRVMASADQTTITTEPPQPGAESVTLNRGEFLEFQSGDNFVVTGSAPILVGQYMLGSTHPGGANTGDPAFTLASPIEQWRRDYIVLTPQAYGQDFLNIVAPTGTEVILDGQPVIGFQPVGDGTWSVAGFSVPDGTHTLVAENPFTVTAYGYDTHVSYAYPGGLNLEAINR